MNTIDIVVGVIVLVVVWVVFVRVRKTPGQSSQALKASTEQEDMLDRLETGSGHVNLPPGIPAPESGYYECLLCGKGGLTYKTATALYGVEEAQRRLSKLKPSMRYFNQNDVFPPCPNCGDSAGWSLLKNQ